MIAARSLDDRKTYYLVYTALFAVICFVVFCWILFNGRTLIWGDNDGLTIHYATFAYMGDWWRQWLTTGVMPQWDYSMGYGSDILLYNSNDGGFQDPFNLISALVPLKYAEYAFVATVFARLYLAGWTFSLYARSRRYFALGSLCGALTYTFSGFCLFWGALRHPEFIMPAIMLPLVLMGIDRVFDAGKPLMYIVTLAATIIMHFYFGYMFLLLTLMYCLYRYFLTPRNRSWRVFWLLVLKMLGFTAIALLISCVALLPLVPAVLATPRVGQSSASAWVGLLQSDYLIPTDFIGSSYNTLGLGMGGFAALCVVALFTVNDPETRGKRHALRVAFIVLAVLAVVPITSSIFNGFSYPTYRWTFAYAFTICCIVAYVVPRFRSVGTRGWIIIGVAGAVFLVWTIVCLGSVKESALAVLPIVLYLLIAGAFFLCAKRGKRVVFATTGLVCVTLSAMLLGVGYVTSMYKVDGGTPYYRWMKANGSAYNRMVGHSPETLLTASSNGALQRSEGHDNGMILNSAMLQKRMGSNYYTDMSNPLVFQFRKQLGFSTMVAQDQQYLENDSSAYVEALLGFKQYLVEDATKGFVPYGFDTLVAQGSFMGKTYSAYESQNALPLAFMFDTAISTADYDALSPVQKREALLQGCVVDDASVSTISPTTSSVDCPYTVTTSGDGVQIDGTRIYVAPTDDTYITLHFNGVANVETYLSLAGVSYSTNGDADSANVAYTTTLYVNSSVLQKKVTIDNKSNPYSAGVNSWCVNCGYSQDAQTTVTIAFTTPGYYDISSLKIQALPMDGLSQRVAALNDGSLSDLQLNTNEISGKTSADRDRLLFLSMPYSEGWTAYIDGQKVDVKCADTAFMALDMPAGEHEFKLVYETPYLRTGTALSLVGIVVLCVLLVVRRRRVQKR